MLEIDGTIHIYDCEVYAHDWLVVFKDVLTGEYTVIPNDNEAVCAFMEKNPFLGGFNIKHYDNYILKAIMMGCEPEEVKQVNDWIIRDDIEGWKIPMFQNCGIYFDSFDLMDDTQAGTSLKSFEAHNFMNIQEAEVDFDLDRKMTDEEMKMTIHYCKCDVDATETLFHLRENYLRNKIVLGAARGYPARKSMYWTNAKLTSVYLGAKKPDVMWTDERDYVYPDRLKREYIPQEVFDFFDKLHDKSIPNEVVFNSSLDITVGGCPTTIAYGGIHGAIPNYIEVETDTRKIRNKDVASYYPHLMTLPLSEGKKYGFTSRAIPDPQTFVDTLEERVQAKRAGDKAKNLALKLVLNTTYGCMGNGQSIRQEDGSYEYVGYNDLYDPLMCRSVCITGQLFLLELSCHLVQECPTLKIIQLNTDGIMVSFDNSDEDKWQEITQEWQDRTGFELEEDFIHSIAEKDVNNYVEVPADGGKPKIKGGYLVRGIGEQGAFKINNDACVVAQAITEYFVTGCKPEDYINACDDIKQYQLIAKASSRYSGAYQIINGEKVPTQKVNRVYASRNTTYGTLFKIHGETGSPAKIAGLPAHCVIDNTNEFSIKDIDKKWYIKLAQKRIDDFLGIKPPKKNTRRINSLKKKSLAILD